MLTINNAYTTLDPRLYHKQPPKPLTNPQAGHFNPLVATQLGWDKDDFLTQNWVNILGGDIVPNGFDPLAMAYAGHQFGQWAGQLGDGRGLLLVQVIDRHGTLTDLHLKGAGLTPYSRMGDGRAVIRSTVREYLAGHALNALGIRSSNALGFVVSDTPVRRESIERGASLLRTADCHIRFGHFEWVANFAPDMLLYFTRYVIQTYFADCMESDTPIADFLRQVVDKTAKTIADWQLFGFAHGVMNTDNLSITGATLDFGPYGFMERFNPLWINNHSDYQGRYVYQNQPSIGQWNLSRLISLFLRLNGEKLTANHKAETLDREVLTEILDKFGEIFYGYYQKGLCQKFGLEVNEANCDFALEFLQLMQNHKLDFTNSQRALVAIVANNSKFEHEHQLFATLTAELQQANALQQFEQWQSDYLQKNPNLEKVINHNPIYILRNGIAQRAIELAEHNDMSEVDRLFQLLTKPFEPNPLAKPSDTAPPTVNEAEIFVSCSS
ncbi:MULTISPECIES: protein adenylyltransferase SelO [unclassified Moraxella]|uniref:protein adenylyltransferase SelO n=1 Tax=unclassified Moraxella TaxID=2685852 RepID=UPI003AF5F07F